MEITFDTNEGKSYMGLSCDELTRSIGVMKNKFDIVIDKREIRVLFDTPLLEPRVVKLVPLFGAKNFTRVGLGKSIAVQYQQIFNDEEKWGVWCCEIDDFYLHSVRYVPEHNYYTLDLKNRIKT